MRPKPIEVLNPTAYRNRVLTFRRLMMAQYTRLPTITGRYTFSDIGTKKQESEEGDYLTSSISSVYKVKRH